MNIIHLWWSYQWKSCAMGMQKNSLNTFDFCALLAMPFAMGFDICLMRTSPSLAAGNAPTAISEPDRRAGPILGRGV